jgi:hypothetical protein
MIVKISKLVLAALAVGAFSASAWGNAFIWNINGGSVNYSSGGSWNSPPSPNVVGAVAGSKSGACAGCVIHFSLPFVSLSHIGGSGSSESDQITFSGATFFITGDLSNPSLGPDFNGTLLSGTLSSFTIDRTGKKYSFDSDPTISSISFAPGLLAAFGLPSGIVSGFLDLGWRSTAVQTTKFFSSASGTLNVPVGSLDLTVAPEPGTFLLLGTGLILFGVVLHRTRRREQS